MSANKADADRYGLLAQAHEMLTEVRFGQPAYRQRLAEMTDGGLTSGGGNGSSAVAYADPTEAQLDQHGRRRRDPAAEELRDFDHELRKVWKQARILHQRWSDVVQPKHSPARMTDPGCGACAQVPNHWCPTYLTTEVEIPKAKGRPEKRRMPLCWWCFRHLNGKTLPSIEQRQAHADGKPVRVPVKSNR